MQPHLHIFSHNVVLKSLDGPKTASQSGSRTRSPAAASRRRSASERAAAPGASGLAQVRALRAGARAAYDPPTGPPAHHPVDGSPALPPGHSLHRSPRAIARAATAIAAALLAGALAACGSTPSPGSSADPASVVPASAPLYAGATVRPGGAQRTAALAAGRALTHQADPYLRLLAALQTPGSPALDFQREVAPWLGPHAAVFLSSLGASGSLLSLLQQGLLGGSSTAAFPFAGAPGSAQGAIVLDTSNEGKARSFLASQAKRAGAHAGAYRGVSYQATPGGLSFAIVRRLAVIGSEAALHEVIDTALGGPSLSGASGYSTLLASAPLEALAHVYSNPAASASGAPGAGRAGAGQAGSAPAGAQEGLAGALALLGGGREANVSLVPSAASIALDADTTAGPAGAPAGLLSSSAQGASTLAQLPGESWLAVGLGDVATTLAGDVQSLRGLLSIANAGPEAPASGTLDLRGLFEGLFTPLAALGADTAQARLDFQSWMGSAGIFASGASLLELKAAVAIESNDPARSRAAVPELGAQLRKDGGSLTPAAIPGSEAALGVKLPGLPVVLDIAAGRGSDGRAKFVLGLGEPSVGAALDPPSALSGAASYAAASSALGEGIKPSIMFDVPTFLSLLEAVGLTEDPTISRFVPYLRNVTTIDGGGRTLGAQGERFRLVAGLTPAG
jgi:Protein of unknown function (DUF3352)